MKIKIFKSNFFPFVLAFSFMVLIFGFFTFNFTYAFQIVPTCTGPGGSCGWTDAVQVLDNILQFAIILAVPLAAALFAWAGFLYLSARGNPGQITKASNIFVSVAIGFVIVLVAWLVVDFILQNLAAEGSYIRLLE